MDTVYQAIKNLLKSFVNLFVAVVELFSGLINGIASLLLKLRPRITELQNKKAEDKALSNDGQIKSSSKTAEKGLVFDIRKQDTELVCAIRSELKDKITDRDQYIIAKANAEMLDKSRVKKIFIGRRKLLINAIIRQLLEDEFKDVFLDHLEEKPKIQAICEMNKEAIS